MVGVLLLAMSGVRVWHPEPRALGLGSVIYVFVLATFLWLILWPLRPAGWNARAIRRLSAAPRSR